MTAVGAMTSTSVTWTPPAAWMVPREWPDSTILIVCSGESAGPQKDLIRRFPGPVIAVKHGVYLRPNAEVLFLSGDGAEMALPLIEAFTGQYIVVRAKSSPLFPVHTKRVTRTKEHGALCELKNHVGGYDTGTSAINLAYHLGATTIVLAGYDMTGGHFCKHPLQNPPQQHFVRHMKPLYDLNADATRKGIRIVNVSPISAVTAFEKQSLEAFL